MRAWWLGVAAAVPVFVLRAWPSLWTTVDDAWISARYAWHAAEGYGLVYSAGEPPVEGYTNLLWTLWLAVGHGIGAPPTGWMVGSGLGFGALGVVAAGLLARSLSDRWWAPGCAALALALDVHHAVVATNGLESSMFVGALLGCAWASQAADARALRWLGPVVGALAAIRPEGVAVGALLWLGRATVLRDPEKRHDLRDVSWFGGGIVGAWAALSLWRVVVYGTPVPNTFSAKATGGVLHHVEGNLAYLSHDAPWWIATAVLGLSAVGATRRTGPTVLAACALTLVAIAFRVELWMPGGRLLVPATSMLLVLACCAPGRVGAGLGVLTLVGSVIAPFTPMERVVRGYDRRHSVVLPNGASRAGEHIARHAPPGSWLAVRDAGVLAAFVGTGVRVAETHDRALTQPHPGGANLDVRETVPENPAFVALTQARENATTVRYPNDRRVFARLTVPYVYLGRVYQHYHRYYDIYAREDLGIPPLPDDVVVNFDGPRP